MSLLVLTQTPNLNTKSIEKNFPVINHYPAQHFTTTSELIEHLNSLSLSPKAILGSTRTPVIEWLTTQHLFPQAEVYLQQTIDNQLQVKKINCSELMTWITPEIEPKEDESTEVDKIVNTETKVVKSNPVNTEAVSTEAVSTEVVSTKVAENKPKASSTIEDLTDSALLFEIFKISSWGRQSHKSELRILTTEIDKRINKNPKLLKRFKKAEIHGDTAFQAGVELEKRMKGPYDFEALKAEILFTHEKTPKILTALNSKLRRNHKYIQKKKANKVNHYHCSIPKVIIKDDTHPNALVNLPKSPTYNVYIDETGENFTTEHQQGERVGKYVAIVVPSTTELPKLNNFHATDAKAKDIDNAITTLLTNKVGIIGFSSGDNIQKSIGWLNGIIQLVKWIAYLLPDAETGNQVLNVVIEQRGQFTQEVDLRIVEDILYDELRTLDNKFDQLSIKMKFADKNHPYLTYADAVALTWGSKSKENNIRLKQSKLKGHCLLSATDNSLDKLYLMANTEFKLSPKEWFTLCAELPVDENSWLNRYMSKVQSKVKGNQETWLDYLGYVHQLLASKNYDTNSIYRALSFLDQSSPSNHELSAELKLRLVSSKLSVTSHIGVMDDTLYKEAVNLINIIEKEDAQLASEGLLRLFSMTTNVFESNKIAPIVDRWLNRSELIAGKLNFAKLHSTKGQILAFENRNEEAVASFNSAIKVFNELNNKLQAKKEITQTQCYLLTVYLANDKYQNEAVELVGHLLSLFGNEIENMASSHSHPYVHHCIVKAITLRKDWFKELHEIYLNSAPKWVSDSTHPWQWINLYRGLISLDESVDKGIELCQEAYYDCTGEGAIFDWMQLVMKKLIIQFDSTMSEINSDEINDLYGKLPNGPIQHLLTIPGTETNDIRQWLNKALPFNFH
jgi:tetratricopeptide (TPR) repeat protein